MKNKYVILQGVQSASGCGDLNAVAYADTLQEAKKLFNKWKKDIKGYSKGSRGSYVYTTLELNNNPDEEPVIIDDFSYDLWK